MTCSFRDRVGKGGLFQGAEMGFVHGDRWEVGRVPKDEVRALQGVSTKLAKVSLEHRALVTMG